MTPLPRRRLALAAVLHALLGAAALVGALPAGAAAPVYRCGNTYQQMPCAEGRQLEVADTRDAAQRLQAERAAAAERKTAAALAAENRARDKSLKAQRQAAGIAPAADPAASAGAGEAQHHAKSSKRKQTAQQATDKTLYSASSDRQAKKKETPAEARMPAP